MSDACEHNKIGDCSDCNQLCTCAHWTWGHTAGAGKCAMKDSYGMPCECPSFERNTDDDEEPDTFNRQEYENRYIPEEPTFDQLREVFDEIEASKPGAKKRAANLGLVQAFQEAQANEYKPLPTRKERRANARAQAKRLFRESR